MAADLGITIISGGAYGCDIAAQRAAIEAGGITVTILGGGCDCPYPARNVPVFQRAIDTGGAVISENAWEHPPLPRTFRLRNRLIASLARATLIVEAAVPSGTFGTADDALAANREILVVPGAITNPNSHGTNRLILQGAIPIIDDESFSDAMLRIYGKFGLRLSDDGNRETIGERRFLPLIDALRAEPLRIDQLFKLLPEDSEAQDRAAALNRFLSEAEGAGIIVRYPDGRFGSTMGI